MSYASGARWRHLARRGKDLLLCGKNLAIEPCYKATSGSVSWTEYYVSVAYAHAKIENPTWHGVFLVGMVSADRYLATYTIKGIEILWSSNKDVAKTALYAKETKFESVDVVRATISVTYSFIGSGSPTYPGSKPSDRTYTEDFGSILEGFAPIVWPGVRSGAVVITREDVGDSTTFSKTSDGSVGYITKTDSQTGEEVNIISIQPPTVEVWSEGGSDTYTDYTPVDDDDNY